MRRLIWALLALSTACAAPSPTPLPPPPLSSSLWGKMVTLGQSEQTSAPAFAVRGESITFAWIGADETGVHQDARMTVGSGLSARVVLPLPPVYPFQQKLAPAGENGTHFLWLDAESAASDAGLRLFSAYVNRDLQVERGPIRVSNRATLRYDFVVNADYGLWVVWSGGLAHEPTLIAQLLDPLSRPRPPQQIAAAADFPALARTAQGIVHVFWISTLDRAVYQAILGDGTLSDTQKLFSAPALNRGDRLLTMQAALDLRYAYLFWTIERADATIELWWASAALNTNAWTAPARLGVEIDTQSTFSTGYNSGTAYTARTGTRWLAWAAPTRQQQQSLPVAAQVDDGLAIIYLQNGQIAGFQRIVDLPSKLAAPPLLHSDRALHLYLSWSSPTPHAAADLNFTTTRR